MVTKTGCSTHLRVGVLAAGQTRLNSLEKLCPPFHPWAPKPPVRVAGAATGPGNRLRGASEADTCLAPHDTSRHSREVRSWCATGCPCLSPGVSARVAILPESWGLYVLRGMSNAWKGQAQGWPYHLRSHANALERGVA